MLQDSSAANSTAIPFERIEVDILKGESRTPEFLHKNHNGRVPVLETESGMFYLSEGTQFFPTDRWQRGKVMQWLCFEQYSHEPYIATTRFWIKALGKAEEYADAIGQNVCSKHEACFKGW